jgi:hypothetical protein
LRNQNNRKILSVSYTNERRFKEKMETSFLDEGEEIPQVIKGSSVRQTNWNDENIKLWALDCFEKAKQNPIGKMFNILPIWADVYKGISMDERKSNGHQNFRKGNRWFPCYELMCQIRRLLKDDIPDVKAKMKTLGNVDREITGKIRFYN